MAEANKELYLVSIVSIVAIVAILILVINDGGISGFASKGYAPKKIQTVVPGPVALLTPLDDAIGVLPNQRFTWEATLQGTDFLILYLDDEPGFSTPIVQEFQIRKHKKSLKMPSGLLIPGATYYWRVVAYNGAGATNSQVRSFTVSESGTIVSSKKIITANTPPIETGQESTETSDNKPEIITEPPIVEETIIG